MEASRSSARDASTNAILAARRGAARTLIDALLERTPGVSADLPAWVASQAAVASGGVEADPRTPELPMSGLRGQAYEAKFRPSIGGALIADFEFVGREVVAQQGAPGVLGSQEAAFMQVVADRRRIVSRYAEDYVAYWLRDARAAMRVRHESLSWDQFRDALGEIRVTDTHDQIRRGLEAMRTAVDVLPPELLAAPAFTQWRDEFTRASTAMGVGGGVGGERRYDEVLRANLANWRDGQPDAGAARSRMLDARAVEFRDRYLGGDARDLPYWGDLFIAGLEILAREHDASVAQVRAELLSPAMWKFPLVVTNDRSDGLGVEAYGRAREQFERIHSLRPVEAARAQPVLVREGAPVGHSRADELLTRMRGSGGAWEGVAGDLPSRLGAILSAFPIEQPTRCVIFRLDYESQRKPLDRTGVRMVRADEAFPYVSIDVGGRAGEEFSLRGEASPMEVRGLRIAAPIAEDVTIRFRPHEGGSGDVVVRLPSAWHFVTLIHERGAEFDQTMGMWKVPIEFTPPGGGGGAGEERTYLWIGVKFIDATNATQTVPRPETWPRPADWGVGR